MKRITEIGTYLLVFILPWQTRWIISAGQINGEGSEYLTYSLYATDILLIALLALAFLHFRKNKPADALKILIEKSWGAKILFLFVAIGMFSIFVADNKLLAMFAEIRILLAVGFFWILFQFADKAKLALVFVGSLTPPAILAIWQFLTQQTFAEKWLGLALHPASIGGTSVIETFADGVVSKRWLRAYGSFDHPNILGGALAIGLLVSLWIFLKWQEKNKEKSLLLFAHAVIAVLSLGLFISFSRSAWLALFLGIIIVGTLLFLQKNLDALKFWMHGSAIIILVFMFMFLSYRDLVIVRTEGNTRLENLSIDQREVYLKQAKGLIENNPVVGVGVGNYISALAKEYPSNPAWTYQPVHNVFLYVWSELGIFGLFLFVILCGFLFWQYGRKNYLSFALLIALVPILLLDHWLWDLHFGILFFVLVVALAVGFSEEKRI